MKTLFAVILLFSFERAFAKEMTDSLKKKNFSFSLQAMMFGRSSGFQQGLGTVNPNNRVAKLNEFDGGLYLRPDLRYKLKNFDFWLKPRLHLDLPKNENPRNAHLWGSTNTSGEFFIQELKARWQINEKSFLQAGRYVRQIGTSIFLNPSNPFILNTGRLNPKIELIPMDFVEFNIATNNDWNYTIIGNIGAANTPIYKEPFLKFSRNYGLLIEHYGNSNNIGIIASVNEEKKLHLGGYGQKNISNALVIWTDFALDYNINRFYPVLGHTTKLIDYEMINGSDNDKLFITGLVGASYTFNWGPTLQVEYYHNGKSYNQDEIAVYNKMLVDSREYNSDIYEKLTNINLGRSLNAGMPYTRKNYVFTQLNQNDILGKLNVNLRNLYSFDDGSNQISSLIEYDATDNLEVYALGLKSFGSIESDLKKLINYQIMIGLIAKF